jgi:hypothetical protein
MAAAVERALNTFVRGGPVRSQDVTVTLENDFFQMLCRRNKKPTTTSVKRWWGMLKRPMDDTNVHCTLNLVRRALLDWPKMGAAIAKMAGEEFAEQRKEKQLRKKFAARLARKLKQQTISEGKQRGMEADGARRKSSGTKCVVKMNHRNSNVAKR